MRSLGAACAALALAACGQQGRSDQPPLRRHGGIARDQYRAPAAMAAAIGAARNRINGPVGISVISIADGWRHDQGCEQLLPQQSVSKLWVAMTAFSEIDRGTLALSTEVSVTGADLTLFHQPIYRLVKGWGYRTNVADLVVRAMTQSDNTANDRVLHAIGGPERVRDMLRDRRIRDVRFGPGERLLQSGTAGIAWQQSYSLPWAFQIARNRIDPAVRKGAYQRYVADPPDGASACGIADGLLLLKTGKALSAPSTAALLSIMASSRTGRARLRAGLRPGWMIAHKTGTGQEYAGRTAGFNDVGILTAPDGHVFVVTVMIGDSASSERARQAMIAQVARSVVDEHDARHPRPGQPAGDVTAP